MPIEMKIKMIWKKLTNSPKFNMRLIQGGGDSFCEALRNTNNKFTIDIDDVLFTIGDIREDGEDDELRDSLDSKRSKGEVIGFGGAIVFSTDVNSIELSRCGFKNWLVQKYKTLTNRFKSRKTLDILRRKNDISAWSVGRGFRGIYTGKNGRIFDENSIVINIVGQKFRKVVKVAKEICEESNQECVMVRDYETNQVYFIDKDSK